MSQSFDVNEPASGNTLVSSVIRDNFESLFSNCSGESEYPNPSEGSFWYKPSTRTLSMYVGGAYRVLAIFLANGDLKTNGVISSELILTDLESNFPAVDNSGSLGAVTSEANPSLNGIYLAASSVWTQISSQYSHPTGDGNSHVPADGGSNEGKVLTASATPGAPTWEEVTTILKVSTSATLFGKDLKIDDLVILKSAEEDSDILYRITAPAVSTDSLDTASKTSVGSIGGSHVFTEIPVQFSDYTVVDKGSVLVEVDTSSNPITIDPYPSPELGDRLRVSDVGNNSGILIVTVTGLGTIQTNGGAMEWRYDGSNWQQIDAVREIIKRNASTNEVFAQHTDTLVANKFRTPAGGEGLEIRNIDNVVVALIDNNGKITARSGEFGLTGQVSDQSVADGDFSNLGANVDFSTEGVYNNALDTDNPLDVTSGSITWTGGLDGNWGSPSLLINGVSDQTPSSGTVSNLKNVNTGTNFLTIDMLSNQVVAGLRFKNTYYGSTTYGYTISTSIDDITYTPALVGSFIFGSQGTSSDPLSFAPVTARYVKILFDNTSFQFFGFQEVEVLGNFLETANTFDTQLAIGTAGSFDPATFKAYDETDTLINGSGKVNVAYAVDGGSYGDEADILIHSDDADGSATFTDSSSNGYSVAKSGSTNHDTDYAKMGASSILFDGTGDSLSVNTLFDPTDQDFLMEAWIRPTNTSAVQRRIFTTLTGTNRTLMLYQNGTSVVLQVLKVSTSFTGSWIATASSALTALTYTHVRATREGDTINVYIDGNLSASVTMDAGHIIPPPLGALTIGADAGGSSSNFIGHMDEIRMYIGPVTGGNFTPPTAPYQPIFQDQDTFKALEAIPYTTQFDIRTQLVGSQRFSRFELSTPAGNTMKVLQDGTIIATSGKFGLAGAISDQSVADGDYTNVGANIIQNASDFDNNGATTDNTFDTNLATGESGTFSPSSFKAYDETATLISGAGKVNVAYAVDGGGYPSTAYPAVFPTTTTTGTVNTVFATLADLGLSGVVNIDGINIEATSGTEDIEYFIAVPNGGNWDITSLGSESSVNFVLGTPHNFKFPAIAVNADSSLIGYSMQSNGADMRYLADARAYRYLATSITGDSTNTVLASSSAIVGITADVTSLIDQEDFKALGDIAYTSQFDLQLQLVGAQRFSKATISTPDTILNIDSSGNVTVQESGAPVSRMQTGGWGHYTDSAYTGGAPLSVDNSRVKLTIDGLGSDTNEDFLPINGLSLWDTSTNKITSAKAGTCYDVRLQFKAKANSQNAYFDVEFDIGGSIGIVAQRTFTAPKTANVETTYSIAIPIFTLSTFVANGCEIYLNTTDDGCDVDVYEAKLFLKMDHEPA